MCPYTFSLNKPCVLLLIVFSMGFSCFGQSTFNIKWGTHHAFDGNLTGPNYSTTDTGFSAAYSSAFLKSLNADGSLGSDLVDDVDLVQLGFLIRIPRMTVLLQPFPRIPQLAIPSKEFGLLYPRKRLSHKIGIQEH